MKVAFVLFITTILWWIIKCRQFFVNTPQEFTDFSNKNVQGIHWSATDILNEVFLPKPPSNYNLKNQPEFTVRPIKTVHYGLNFLAYLGSGIWELLPNNFKKLESAEAFKSTIKGWIPENCQCRICKPYIYQMSFT